MKISLVSYFNTKPFLLGLENFPFEEKPEIIVDFPSACADKLISGEVDMGLVPVAIIPQIPGAQIVSNYCIGASDYVATVNLYSDCPIEEIKDVYLDYQSRSSVLLLRFLFEKHWRRKPYFIKAKEGYEHIIGGQTAGLIIGDRAISPPRRFEYCYDLAEAWKQATGLPFVFAAWVARKKPSPKFLQEFEQALEYGLGQRAQIIEKYQARYPHFDMTRYYHEWIEYELTGAKRKGLELFLSYVRSFEAQKQK